LFYFIFLFRQLNLHQNLTIVADGKKKRSRSKENGEQPKGAEEGRPARNDVDLACQLKAQLLEKVEKFGDKLPPNTLDFLIGELGGPDSVAEVGLMISNFSYRELENQAGKLNQINENH
jgi:hypothetical protein